MKKAIAFVLVLLLAGAFAWAAGGAEKARAAAPREVTLRYAFWGNPDAIGVERDIIDAFVAKNPTIRIEPVVSAWAEYHTKLLTHMAGGAAPDIMRVDSFYFHDFMKVNALRSLDDLVRRDGIDLGIYYPQGIVENTFQGRLYGLPWGTAALYMLLNLRMFREAGVPLPPLDWTMDDFVATARRLTRGEGENRQFGYANNFENLGSVLPFVWAHGGDLFDEGRRNFTLNRPEGAAALQMLASLHREGITPPDALTATADVMNRWMVNNRIAMFMGAAINILTLQRVDGFEFEAWPMPVGRGRPRTTVFKSNIVGISAASRHVEEAWTFLKFLRGHEGEMLYMQARRMPPTIADDKYWAVYADPTRYPRRIAEISKRIADAHGRLLPLRSGWLEIDQTMRPVFAEILLGRKPAQQALNEIAPRIQDILARADR